VKSYPNIIIGNTKYYKNVKDNIDIAKCFSFLKALLLEISLLCFLMYLLRLYIEIKE